MLYDNFNAIGWEPCQAGSGVGLVDTGGMKDRHGVLAVCQGLGKQCCHPYWREKRVCLFMATHGGGGVPETNGIPALVLGTPGAPTCLFLLMDPLFPSPEPCFGPGERCFLRQLWLWPLQLEHPGGGGKRNQVMGWGLGPVVRIEFLHSPRQKKLSNLRSEGNSAFKAQTERVLSQNLCWQPETDVDLGGRESPLWATIKERLKGQAPRGRWNCGVWVQA